MAAAQRFAAGDKTADIAADLRVGVRQVEKWRSAFHHGGIEALRSKGPHTAERLGPEQFARLAAQLERGPAAHGFDDQRWTLKRIAVLIARLFGITYTEQGVWCLLRRHGFSCQVPARRASERDEDAVEGWRRVVWPQVEALRRPGERGSSSKTNPVPR